MQANDLAVNKKTLLYVGGLDEKVDESTVKAAFMPFGDVVMIDLPRDQLTHHHRGFAFVEFEEPGDAAAAIENMNDSELFGRVLKVNHARSTSSMREGIWAQANSWYDSSLTADASEVDSLIRNQKNSGKEGETDDKENNTEKTASKKRVRLKEVAYVRRTGELETYVMEEAIPEPKKSKKKKQKK
mmetsp:Transcript_10558/g.19275  ORF Transcript_10558/g.19275 Transcript_10558/m.19275 type:complete len:186 (+) Transcript_10558:139-696(+)